MIHGVYNMPRFAMKNRREVEGSALAGCFHCAQTFTPADICEYTDGGETCLCPKCGIDAVVGDMGIANEVTEEKLQRAKLYWFNSTKAESSRS